MKNPLLIALFILTTCLTVQAQNNNSDILKKLQAVAVVDQKVMMPMRDGIRLATDIYRPKTDKKVPIIFSKTPYNFNSWGNGEQQTRTLEQALEVVKKGYAYVVQNERGRYFSEGNWDILGTPLTDGYDAFTWLKNQTWSNGKIGTLGCSSTAEWQMAVAALDHPALGAMVPQSFGAGVGRVGNFVEQGNWYRGGAEQMLFFAWLYGVEHDKFKPRIPKEATQEDLIRISRYYDLGPENPEVQLADSQAFGKGSRSSINAMINSCAKCGCEPPCPAPCVKLKCVFSATSYTPFVVKSWISLGNKWAKSGTVTRSGISCSSFFEV